MKVSNKWLGRASFCILLFFITACAANRGHTSDSKLEDKFHRYEAQFEALRTTVQADERLQIIEIGRLRYENSWLSDQNDQTELGRIGLSRERWVWYQEQMRQLGLVQVVRESNGVTFNVDPESFSNGDSCKGYEYVSTPPMHQKSSLDKYRPSENERAPGRFGDYLVHKHLKGHRSVPSHKRLGKGWSRGYAG